MIPSGAIMLRVGLEKASYSEQQLPFRADIGRSPNGNLAMEDFQAVPYRFVQCRGQLRFTGQQRRERISRQAVNYAMRAGSCRNRVWHPGQKANLADILTGADATDRLSRKRCRLASEFQYARCHNIERGVRRPLGKQDFPRFKHPPVKMGSELVYLFP